MDENILWVERYRPKTVEECILPEEYKKTFEEFVKKKEVPNLLLSGGPGVGKTTIAKAVLNEVGCDYIIINGSMRGNIDTLRNDISNYATTVSFTGGRKYVILDEADHLNQNSTQPALRNFMEEYSVNCGFILTCNFKNRIIEPLHSRCSVIEFRIPREKRKEIMKQFIKRTLDILKKENIPLENNDIAPIVELIKKYFPDFRRILNELQRYSATGRIDNGLLVNFADESFKNLTTYLKEKNFTEMRKWVAENSNLDFSLISEKFYESVYDYLEEESIPQMILYLNQYDYRNAFVVNPEINLVAMFTEIMRDCRFK